MLQSLRNRLRTGMESRRSRRFFWRSLSAFLLVTCIPGLITGSIIYWTSTIGIESELQKLHEKQVQQRAENIDDQLSYMEMLFSQWAFDAQFDYKLKELDFTYNFIQVRDIYRTLFIMEGAHPLISNVELYLKYPQPLIFNRDVYRNITDEAWSQRYEAMLQHTKFAYWTDSYEQLGKEGEKPLLALVNKVPAGSSEPLGCIITLMDKEKLRKMLQTLTPYNEGTAFLLSPEGEGFIVQGEADKNGLELALKDAITGGKYRTDSFLYDYNGEKYSVSVGEFSRIGEAWIYVSAAPLTAITAPMLFVSKLILLISGSGFLLALVLSLGATYRLYTPIGKLVRLLPGNENHRDEFELIEQQWLDLTQERQTLQKRLESHLPQMREGFMLQLVQGHLLSMTEKDIRDRLLHYGWETEGKQFVAALIQLGSLSGQEGRFKQGDESLVTFAAANIVSELSGSLSCQLVNFHDLTLGLLIAFPDEMTAKEQADILNRTGEEWIQAVARVLKLRMTIAISSPVAQIRHSSLLLEEARQALSFAELGSECQIIEASCIDKRRKAQGFRYPFTLEKEIIQAVRIGSEEEAAQLIERFLKELAQDGAAKFVMQQGMMQLLGSLQHAMLHSGINPMELFGGVNLYEQLGDCNEPADILRWFRSRVVGPYVHELISRQDYQLKKMVEKTIGFINERYMSFELSLDWCADQFGTSAYTLSRAFKTVTGLNFIDYLTNIRLEKAKELLRETDMKINDVAAQVSYQQTYFNRIFKKYEGITPGQYREMHQDKG
ncbi:helix-turn-helix domain-containing protein [Paenibacillus sp. YN15]|uniref:helix-turn-helix domain-containing protein n=1 Tax=Paenibacillus sp. YN15 TaxID=1742774 RepID=UPI000DCE697E|nr:helix-turn-helix domain-containing protein [Paenibacillus sp. YN15]RAU96136.1 AraC family transcriptional regulator [Paenibacillus sp. YN15]